MKRSLEILVLSFALILVGCSSRSTPVSVEPVTDTQADTDSDYDYDYNYQQASSTNSNLWDTTTTNDPVASPTPSPSPSPVTTGYPSTPSPWTCLNGNSGYQAPPTTTTNSNTPPWYTGTAPSYNGISNACFKPDWGGVFGDDMLFEAGLGSFGAMQTCYETVMSKGPQYCAAGYAADQVFQMAQMALTRCFRHILRQQMQVAQWAPPQQQTYQTSDTYMYLLLQLFSQDQ